MSMLINHKSPEAHQRYKNWVAFKKDSGFYWQGKEFQAGEQSLAAVTRKAFMIGQGLHDGSVIKWRASDNSFYHFNEEEFLAFASSMNDYVESLLMRIWESK